MNNSLNTLIKKIQFQIEELDQQIAAASDKIKQIDEQLGAIRDSLEKSLTIPAFILPEKEISRLNFIIKQQQSIDEIGTEKTQYESQITCIENRKKRLKIELKMLEKYQAKVQEKTLKIAQKKDATDQDEFFVINHKKSGIDDEN